MLKSWEAAAGFLRGDHLEDAQDFELAMMSAASATQSRPRTLPLLVGSDDVGGFGHAGLAYQAVAIPDHDTVAGRRLSAERAPRRCLLLRLPFFRLALTGCPMFGEIRLIPTAGLEHAFLGAEVEVVDDLERVLPQIPGSMLR